MNSLREHPGFAIILEEVADRFGIDRIFDLVDDSRRIEPLATARFAAAYLTRKHLRAPLSEIARTFGKASQNWAILAIHRTEDRISYDPRSRDKILGADEAIASKRGPLFNTRAA